MIPMMKLKGDTLKCGLDPNATLRVLVHVSEPIGETLEISPNLRVTMISNSARERDARKKKQAAAAAAKLQKENQQSAIAVAAAAANNDANASPDEVSWEYNPALAAVVVKSQVQATGDGAAKSAANGQVRSTSTSKDNKNKKALMSNTILDLDDTIQDVDHEEGEEDDGNESNNLIDDEVSCTSSAYMSAIYPTKSMGRSYSTATTRTTVSGESNASTLSDLTDQHSWLSQTGIEVVPFAFDLDHQNAASSSAVPKQVSMMELEQRRSQLPTDSRLRYYEDEASSSGDTDEEAMTRGTGTSSSTTDEEEASRTLPVHLFMYPHHLINSKRKSWQRRLACTMPICGSSPSMVHGGVGRDGVGPDGLPEEEDVVTTQKYSLMGRCNLPDMRPGASYWTEDGGYSFLEGDIEDDDDSDDDDDSSDSSSESTLNTE